MEPATRNRNSTWILAISLLLGAIYIQGAHAYTDANTSRSTAAQHTEARQEGQAIGSCAWLHQGVAALLACVPARASTVLSLREAHVLTVLPQMDGGSWFDAACAFRPLPQVWGGGGACWQDRARDGGRPHQTCATGRRVLGSGESSRAVWILPPTQDSARGWRVRAPSDRGRNPVMLRQGSRTVYAHGMAVRSRNDTWLRIQPLGWRLERGRTLRRAACCGTRVARLAAVYGFSISKMSQGASAGES